MNKKLLVIVPSFNEEENLPGVIEEIKASLPGSDILVINDCSTDDTSRVARKTGKARVMDLPYNLGIGGAVQTGFKYALRHGYDYAVQVDGDGQHIASEVVKLIEAMETTGCDMVIGSRFLEVESFRTTAVRRFGIGLFCFLYRLLARTRITDGTSGFRAYNKRCIEYLGENYPEDYPEPEAVIMLKKRGFSIAEVGVEMRERKHGKSSITPFKSVYYMIKVVLSIFFSYFRG